MDRFLSCAEGVGIGPCHIPWTWLNGFHLRGVFALGPCSSSDLGLGLSVSLDWDDSGLLNQPTSMFRAFLSSKPLLSLQNPLVVSAFSYSF
ncbi:hypothetical protein L6452_13359 [Arctium lappa]|uniref:Uncharacterized protein n=1 Tax=Arctium lappa TaxID=4217 RepID=A0ACB9CI32_ARCLA|nr:hypothetical protein L6452_13359 [Arctium lappa]